MRIKYYLILIIFGLVSFCFSFLLINLILSNLYQLNSLYFIAFFILLTSSILSIQGLFTLIWMLYAWENPENVEWHKSPREFYQPKHSFTALIPARHEEKVIKDTIKAVNNINYPNHLRETLVLCREDDQGTITKAQEAIKELEQKNIRLILFNSFPINKPHGLNYGLKEAKNEIVTIFDAEDEPHPDIYNIVNTVLIRDQVDVVQSGVQLMNYRAHWFSALNVMEYFLWFKSGLHFFLRIGNVTPLGGNTVFFKKQWLEKIGGWDENCLTEDADIGIRLILAGAKTRVIYDEQHSTQEETPTCVAGFIKQRTRWNQGFLQIFLKDDWKKLLQLRQKLVTLYVLLAPLTQSFFLLYVPVSMWVAFTQKMPVMISLFSFIPLYLFILQILVYIVGLYEFTKAYKLRYPFWIPIKILITFYPYQLMLMFSSFRALYRLVFSKNGWEKTLHTNGHREMSELPFFTGIPMNDICVK
jgi:cellulose synthase/poly-beta-1,6-N-acetylglucosamine synthase-like glycosyltransferase